MISASLRSPTALKALFSSKDENADWSRRVSETEFEQNAVLPEIFAQQIGDVRDELGAALVQAVHGVTRRHGLHGVDETAFEQIANAVDRERFGAERLRGRGNTFGVGMTRT